MFRTGSHIVCGRPRGRWRSVAVAVAFGVGGLWGCDSSGEKPPAPAQDVSPVVSEWRPMPTTKPADKQVGDDCSVHGASECMSGLCVHVRAQRGLGYVCSARCQKSSECPSQWRCVSVIPGGQEATCLPPVPTTTPASRGT